MRAISRDSLILIACRCMSLPSRFKAVSSVRIRLSNYNNRTLSSRPPTNPQNKMSGKYIVVFKNGVTKEQVDEYVKSVNDNGGKVEQRYDSVLNGFSAVIPESFLQSLEANIQAGESPIDYIEPDGVVTTQ